MNSPTPAPEKPKTKLFAFFYGRINRPTYWTWLGIFFGLYALLALAGARAVPLSEVIFVIAAIPRLHDIGKPGWYALVPIAGEIIALFVMSQFLPLENATGMAATVMIILVGLVIWLGTMPGEPNPNRYGNPPKPGVQWGAPSS